MSNPNPYEAAVTRYRVVRELYVSVRKAYQDVVNALEEEWTAAEHNLARYESSPGVPLPQYRQPPLPPPDTPEDPFGEGWDGETHRGNL
jgi:hypothetical protein